MIKAIIFDLDDTLYDCLHENDQAVEDAVMTMARRYLYMDPGEVRAAFMAGRDQIKKEMAPCGDMAAQHNRLLYIQRMLEILGVNPFDYALDLYDCFWNTFLERIRPFPGAIELLKWIKSQGLQIGICTDMTAHIQYRKIDTLELRPYLDALTTSEEVGVEKPDRRMFERALGKFGVEPSEALYVGDSYRKDVMGAIRAGIRPIWYLSLAVPQGEDVAMAHDMEELKERIQQILEETGNGNREIKQNP